MWIQTSLQLFSAQRTIHIEYQKTSKQSDLNLTKNCEFYGEYKDTDLPNIINIENPDLILFTSIFDVELYKYIWTYTLSS